VNGKPVVGGNAAIFDTGTSLILGDPDDVAALFGEIDGAQLAPDLGDGLYTSAFSIATDQSTHIHIPSIPQSLAHSILPSLLT
jgi:hypothetical protein